jgi:K+-sensing histidine kinase KdpD/CheY-like chemotaxis protein
MKRSGLWSIRSPLLTYGLAATAVALVTTLKLVVPPLGADAPFLLMLGPTLLASWYGGLGPGILAAMLGVLAVNYFFLPPTTSVWIEDPKLVVHSLVFGGMDALTAGLVASAGTARRRAETVRARIDGLYSVSVALGATRTIEDIAELILRETVRVLGASKVGIFVVSGRDRTLRLLTHLGRDTRFLPLARLRSIAEISIMADDPVALVARSKTSVVIESEQEFRERFPLSVAALEGRRLPPAMIAAPTFVHGRAVGVLVVVFTEPRRFATEDRLWVQALAQDCCVAVERTRLFEQERRARVEAQQASRAKDELLAVVSSELLTPLGSITSWAHTLKNSQPTERSNYEHGLAIIERSALAEARLIDDILEMSRIVGRRRPIEVKSIDLNPLVRGTVESLRAQAVASGIDLGMGSQVEAVLAGDADRLRQAMHKILANTFRFTHAGGHVRVDMELVDSCVSVKVRDDGEGIAPDRLARVRDSLRPDGGLAIQRERGVHLGLFIANYIVQEHGGTLRIDSAGADRGTEVTMALPLPAHRLPAASQARWKVGGASLAGTCVLVVDDDTEAREALAEMLAAAGAGVRAAPFADAIEELSDSSPHIVVADADNANAQSFMGKVRALPTTLATVPALALTTRSRPEDANALIAAGYQRQLAKPPEPRMLVEVAAQLGGPRA